MYPDKPTEYAPPPPAAVTGVPVIPNTQFQAQTPRLWSTGLCDCFSDCSVCCLTCWCPCITFGRIAEIVDRGTTSWGTAGALYSILWALTGCNWIYSCSYRSKLRAQYNLLASPCPDCCAHFWCEPCALSQEYRELRNQGFDMTLGWQLNMVRQSGGVAQPPTVQGGMMR